MSSIIDRRLIAVGVTAAAVAISGVPSAHAAGKTDKKQNAAIKKVAKAGKKINKKANAAKSAADAAADAAAVAGTTAASADQKGTDAGAATTALSTKVDAIVATATDSLKKLADGLTAAGAGLTKLGDFIGADEYGVVSISYGTSTTPTGCFYESGNIPDNLQDAIVTGGCLIPDAIPAGTAIHLNAAIRSNEVDGAAGGNAAGVAGIVAYTQTGSTTVDKGGTANSATVLAAVGGGATTPSTGGAGDPPAGVPALTIPLKSPPTSTTETSFAFAPISTDNFVDLGSTRFAGTPAAPTVGPGTGRAIAFTVRFNDLTSAADNPKE